VAWQVQAHGSRRLACVYIQAYIRDVRFGWDARKSDRNLEERGFDFEFATLVFDGPTLEREDARRDYGERRIIAIGLADGIALTVIYTDRVDTGERVRRIISARVSNRREREAYEEAVERRP
jgi:uncharacterized DUF497 family protein